MKKIQILTINPGSTSTKIAFFENTKTKFLKKLKHSQKELAEFEKITDQYAFRKDAVMKEIKDADLCLDDLVAVVGRGGLVKPLESGIYEVNEPMRQHLREGVMGQHASNLGGLIADDIAGELPHAKAYIADPVVVDEMREVARVAGHPKFERRSIFHALNQKAVARTYAKAIGRPYDEISLIIAHLGGGISVGAHCKGKVIDVNNALDGEGPFSPERSGSLPTGDLIKMAYSGDYTQDELYAMVVGKGGMVAYLGTNDAYEMETRAKQGDEKARLIENAMAYQVAKYIGSMATVLKGRVDGILLTGGIAYDLNFVNYIKEMVSFIAPVTTYQGEDEMQALAMNAFMALTGEIEVKTYEG